MEKFLETIIPEPRGKVHAASVNGTTRCGLRQRDCLVDDKGTTCKRCLKDIRRQQRYGKVLAAHKTA